MNDQWFYGQDGQQHGPVTLAELQQLLATQRLRPDDLIWREGMPNWLPAHAVPEAMPASPRPGGPPPAFGAPHPPQQIAYAPYDAEGARLAGSATTAMWFGIVSLAGAFCCAPIGIGFGIAAIIKGRNARFAPNNGSATAGWICGAIGLALGLLSLLVSAGAMLTSMSSPAFNTTTTVTAPPPRTAPSGPSAPPGR